MNTDSSLAALATQAIKIPEPRSYFQGALAPDLLLPTNILLFHRRKGASLHSRGRSLHHRHVLIFNLRCAANVVVDDLVVRVNPGQALLIFPYQFHGYQIQSPGADLVWTFVTFDLERGSLPESLRQRPITIQESTAEHLRNLIALWLSRETPERNAQVTLETAQLLQTVSASSSEARRRRGHHEPAKQDDFDRMLAKVCRIIQARMHDGIRIKNIASDASISESHLRLLFRTRMGASLGDYLQSMRMIRAAQLLAQSELSIETIGQRCGYGSIYAFSRAFKKSMSQSPRAFRKDRR